MHFREDNQRQSNIELLRSLAILGVIVLHFNQGGGTAYISENEVNSYIVNFNTSIFCCVVDLFIMISGYFMVYNNCRSLYKPVLLCIEVVVINVLTYIIECIFSGISIEPYHIAARLLPSNYFVIIYIALYIISPLFNKIAAQLQRKELIILFMVLSCWSTVIDVLSEIAGSELRGSNPISLYGSQWGYSLVNFSLAYIIGAYLRKSSGNSLFNGRNRKLLIVVLIGNIILLSAWSKVDEIIGFSVERTAWAYSNPLVLINAAIFLLFFLNIKMGSVPIINFISKGTFFIYLTHNIILKQIDINLIMNMPTAQMMLFSVFAIISTFIISFLAYLIFENILFKHIGKMLSRIKLLRADIYR